MKVLLTGSTGQVGQEIIKSIQLTLQNLKNYKNELPSVSDLIYDSIKQLTRFVEFDSKIKNISENLISIQNDIENLIYSLTDYLEYTENEDTSLEEIQNRLFFLRNLERTFSLDLPQ